MPKFTPEEQARIRGVYRKAGGKSKDAAITSADKAAAAKPKAFAVGEEFRRKLKPVGGAARDAAKAGLRKPNAKTQKMKVSPPKDGRKWEKL